MNPTQPNPERFCDSLPAKQFDETIPEIQQWMAEGRALVHAASGHQWATADWMLRGERTIGLRAAYDLAEEATGYSRKTLQEWAYVARHVSMRMEDLSFNHHQVVAPLLPETQKRLLEAAAAKKLSVGALREMARWQPHRLNSEIAREEASLLLRFVHRAELEALEITARQLGFTSDEGNSACGKLIHQFLIEGLKAHQDLHGSVLAEYEVLAGSKYPGAGRRVKA